VTLRIALRFLAHAEVVHLEGAAILNAVGGVQPTLCARKVIVCVARTAEPRTAPLPVSSPLGASIASTGAPLALILWMMSAKLVSTSRDRPRPRRPSRMSEGLRLSGQARTTLPPRDE
jgi:hypothetical protein